MKIKSLILANVLVQIKMLNRACKYQIKKNKHEDNHEDNIISKQYFEKKYKDYLIGILELEQHKKH